MLNGKKLLCCCATWPEIEIPLLSILFSRPSIARTCCLLPTFNRVLGSGEIVM